MDVGDPQDPKATFNASAVMAQSIASKSEAKRGSVELSDRAEQVASQFAQNPISPFVLAAVLRIIEFFAVVSIGLGVYFGTAQGEPLDGNLMPGRLEFGE